MNREVRRRKAPGEFRFAWVVFLAAGVAAGWAITTLFPVELRQTGRWLQAMFDALRR